MNLVKIAEAGRLGQNQGLSIGLNKLNVAMCGLNKNSYIVVGASNKVGKTVFCNTEFVINVYLNNPDKNVKWVYYSYEMNREQMAFRFASYFIYKDYGEKLSTNYLSGRAKSEDKKQIIISDKHLKYLEQVNTKYIIPLFGTYDDKDNLIEEGKILFFDKRDEPDNIKKFLEQLAEKNGKVLYETYTEKVNGINVEKKKVSGYVPNPNSPQFIVILDHFRKVKRPTGMSEKDTVDLMSGYFADLAKFYGYTCIGIIHLNREIGDLDLVKFLKDGIYPNEDHVKSTGNLGEDCTELITLFDAKNSKFKLTTHFGLDLKSFEEDYRSVHLVLSRYSECPIHIQTKFDGLIGSFDQI